MKRRPKKKRLPKYRCILTRTTPETTPFWFQMEYIPNHFFTHEYKKAFECLPKQNNCGVAMREMYGTTHR